MPEGLGMPGLIEDVARAAAACERAWCAWRLTEDDPALILAANQAGRVLDAARTAVRAAIAQHRASDAPQRRAA